MISVPVRITPAATPILIDNFKYMINYELNLKPGDRFIPSWLGNVRPLLFEVISIDPDKNMMKAKVLTQDGHFLHWETWEDLNLVLAAFSNGDYIKIQN